MDTSDRQRRSPALLAAQQKLLDLRQKHRIRQQQQDPLRKDHGRSNPTNTRPSDLAGGLPGHLGWGSEPLTAAIRAVEAKRNARAERSGAEKHSWHSPISLTIGNSHKNKTSENIPAEAVIRLYPDLAMAMLKHQLVASGRIWLLLHHLDKRGCGWINIGEARERLTGKKDALRVCGWRQLRKLFTQGEGIFWRRHNDRIWLRSIAKSAASLGIRRLSGLPIALPLSILLGSIGTIRAHFYASFHSGRSSNAFRSQSRPMGRKRLQELGRISRRTQRRYEQRTNVRCQHNYAIARHFAVQHHQEQAWKRGRAVFLFTDRQGKLGPKGATYTAWQLPNSYEGPHEHQAKGRQKRINRELADLFMKGMTGNSKFSDSDEQPLKLDPHRCFFADGSKAGESYNRFPQQDAYWRSNLNSRCDYRLWHILPARENK